jgi:hypothetical protein
MSLIKKADVKKHLAAKHSRNRLAPTFPAKGMISRFEADRPASDENIESRDKRPSSDLSIPISTGRPQTK